MSAKIRDWRFESLRLFSMLLIVTAHYFASDNWDVHVNPDRTSMWTAAIHDSLIMLGQVGVTLFVLISAFFLTNTRKSPLPRVIRLWIQVFVYSFGCYIIYIAGKACVGPLSAEQLPLATPRNTVASIFPVTMGAYWFISAFIATMLLGPFLNVLANSLHKQSLLILIVILIWITFIWKIINPLTLQYFTDIGYFCTIYMIGAFIKNHHTAIPSISTRAMLLLCSLGFLLCVVGTHIVRSDVQLIRDFGYPNNLFTAGTGATPIIAVAMGTIIFVRVAQTKPPIKESHIGTAILCISPATLGVYLIHENFIVKQYLWKYIFDNISMTSIGEKIFISIAVIMVLYALLLFISFFINKMIIKPVIHLLDKYINRLDVPFI